MSKFEPEQIESEHILSNMHAQLRHLSNQKYRIIFEQIGKNYFETIGWMPRTYVKQNINSILKKLNAPPFLQLLSEVVRFYYPRERGGNVNYYMKRVKSGWGVEAKKYKVPNPANTLEDVIVTIIMTDFIKEGGYDKFIDMIFREFKNYSNPKTLKGKITHKKH